MPAPVILVINPGSTSTKVSVFDGEQERFAKSIPHAAKDLAGFAHVADQHELRRRLIEETLAAQGVALSALTAIAARGGLLRPMDGGTYAIDAKMVEDLHIAKWGEHASNLGALVAWDMAQQLSIPAYIVDPVVVDEMLPLARISGSPLLERRSIFHALNHKAVARVAARELGKPCSEINLIVAHLGGGVSVAAHRKGRVIDVNNALDGDGPFSPERAGGVPAGQLIELCYSGVFTKAEIKKALVGKGGMVALVGTNDMREVAERVATGDAVACLNCEAMAYQVAKEIGACAAVLEGVLDAVVLTGGMAHNEPFVRRIRQRIEWIGRVLVFPGEEEMVALAQGALRVLREEERAQRYDAATAPAVPGSPARVPDLDRSRTVPAREPE